MNQYETTTKGERITKIMIESQFELLEEIAKRRAMSRDRVLFEAIRCYTWAYIQERGKELRNRIGDKNV